MRTTRYAAPAVLLVTLGLAAVGCSGDDGSGASEPPMDHSTMSGHDMSGMPGMPGMSGVPGMPVVPTPPASASYDRADGEFLVMMIPHHRQALEMVALARTRASDPGLRAVADRIDAAQGPEILVMSQWLADHGIDLPPADMHGMTMTGMLSDDQMDQLAAADGAEFDRLFLAGMVKHHEGAIAMADDELRDGKDVRILELAGDIKATQTAEIDAMQGLLDRLG